MARDAAQGMDGADADQRGERDARDAGVTCGHSRDGIHEYSSAGRDGCAVVFGDAWILSERRGVYGSGGGRVGQCAEGFDYRAGAVWSRQRDGADVPRADEMESGCARGGAEPAESRGLDRVEYDREQHGVSIASGGESDAEFAANGEAEVLTMMGRRAASALLVALTAMVGLCAQ